MFKKILARLTTDPEKQKQSKFRELESMFDGDIEMLNNMKATWLCSRGNNYGRKGKFDIAMTDFIEATELKNDYLPAFFGMSSVYALKDMESESIKILNSAPDEMKLHGKIVATKKEALLELGISI
ncbi:hypothetical protein COB18_00345 [Candidatus Kaiserbacteria bacterium]|nr:MAG: hypothetical protein COB18_00345 [Candidatus Kaiserbacteria bacterium]